MACHEGVQGPRHMAGLRSCEHRTMQLHRRQTTHTPGAVGCVRGRAVITQARAAGVITLPSPQSDQATAAGGRRSPLGDSPRAHMDLMRASDDNFRGIWTVLDEIKDAIRQQHKDSLLPAETKITTDGRKFFPGDDGRSSFDIEVFKGHESKGHESKVAWLSAPRSVVVSPFSECPESVGGKFALGGRVNAYVSSKHTYAPNLDIELYHWPGFNKLFMYLNLVPRRSLFQFPDDITHIYETQHATGCEDDDPVLRSYQDLFMECEGHCAKSGWQRFTSKDAFVRALTGGNAMIYQMPVTPENLAEVQRLARSVHKIWEALMAENSEWRPGADKPKHRECEQAALEQTDARLLGWAKRDPDAKQAERLVGKDRFREMLALLTRFESEKPDAAASNGNH